MSDDVEACQCCCCAVISSRLCSIFGWSVSLRSLGTDSSSENERCAPFVSQKQRILNGKLWFFFSSRVVFLLFYSANFAWMNETLPPQPPRQRARRITILMIPLRSFVSSLCLYVFLFIFLILCFWDFSLPPHSTSLLSSTEKFLSSNPTFASLPDTGWTLDAIETWENTTNWGCFEVLRWCDGNFFVEICWLCLGKKIFSLLRINGTRREVWRFC